MKFNLWQEGYLITGMEGKPDPASFMGTYEADTFQEAVMQWFNDDESRKQYYQTENGKYFYWGCRIYDNETEARKTFG